SISPQVRVTPILVKAGRSAWVAQEASNTSRIEPNWLRSISLLTPLGRLSFQNDASIGSISPVGVSQASISCLDGHMCCYYSAPSRAFALYYQRVGKIQSALLFHFCFLSLPGPLAAVRITWSLVDVDVGKPYL